MPEETSDLLKSAFKLHQSKEFDKAEQIYRDIIRSAERSVDANQLLGALLVQTDRAQEAIPFLQEANAIAPNQPNFLLNLGTAFSKCGERVRALSYYERAISLAPSYKDALLNAATVCAKLKRYTVALGYFDRYSQLHPQSGDWLLSWGTCLLKSDKHENAAKVFRRYLEVHPDHPGAIAGAAQALLRSDDKGEESLEFWLRYTELRPNHAGAFNNLATVLKNLKRYDDAIRAAKRSIELKPEFFPALCNLGIAQAGKREFEVAEKTLLEAVQLFELRIQDPISAAGTEEEIPWNEYASVAYCQLASVSNILGKYQQAKDAVAKAIALDSNDVEANLLQGFLFLQHGDYENGWPQYEWRRKRKDSAREIPGPRWNLDAADDCHVLIHAEQGLGDTIMFCRYAELVKKRAQRVTILCHRPLVRLLASNVHIDEIIADGDTLPDYDYQIPMLSLPYEFGTRLSNVPGKSPYLFASPKLKEDWHAKLQGFTGYKIGISWQGNKEFSQDHMRSVPLGMFEAIASVSGVELFSLQKGDAGDEIDRVQFHVERFEGLDENNGAFMDTAAIMANLDLIVSSDTATAHLAGALGVEVWLAKSFASEWRWFSDSRKSTPWYPTMRMFRQTNLGNWQTVFAAMREQIQLRLSR